MDLCQTSLKWSKGIGALHYTLKNKEFLCWQWWLHEEPLTSKEALHKSFLEVEEVSLNVNVHDT